MTQARPEVNCTCANPGLGGQTLGEAKRLCALGNPGSEGRGPYRRGDPSYSAMATPPIILIFLLLLKLLSTS